MEQGKGGPHSCSRRRLLTAYDYQTAKILDEVGIDLILVGDTLGMVVQGWTDTKSVTVEDMIYHTRVVARAAKKTSIIGDMPIKILMIGTLLDQDNLKSSSYDSVSVGEK